VAEDNGEIVSFVDLLWLEPPKKGVGFAVLIMALVHVLPMGLTLFCVAL
jgi:hypothetical protein